MTRRGFLKLAAAGAAVAIVPVQVVEAIAPLPEPVKAADVVARRLWRVDRVQWMALPGDRYQLDLQLVAGACRIDLSMWAMQGVISLDSELELDVRLVDGKPLVFIDDKVAEGIRRFSVAVEYPTRSCLDLDGVEHRSALPSDTEPLKQLTAYKQLPGQR